MAIAENDPLLVSVRFDNEPETHVMLEEMAEEDFTDISKFIRGLIRSEKRRRDKRKMRIGQKVIQ